MEHFISQEAILEKTLGQKKKTLTGTVDLGPVSRKKKGDRQPFKVNLL